MARARAVGLGTMNRGSALPTQTAPALACEARRSTRLGVKYLTISFVPRTVVAGQQAVVGDEAIGIGGELATERGIANQTV